MATANFTSDRSGFSTTQQTRGCNRGNGPSRQQGQHRPSNGSSRGRQHNNNSDRPISNHRCFQLKCQYCDQTGHAAKNFPKLQSSTMTANCVGPSDGQENKWLSDFTASHNITGDLQNLSIHSEYDSTDEVLFSDGTGLVITHIGSLTLPMPKKTFHIHDTLYVPHIHKNLISVHHFTKHYNIFLELHPLYFLMKEQSIEAILLRGARENGVYMFPCLIKYYSWCNQVRKYTMSFYQMVNEACCFYY